MSAVPSSAQVKLTIITNKRPVARRACLSCRDKKIKCDGEPISTLSDGRQSKIVTEKVRVCSNCKFLGIECVFVQSLRGGRRRKRTPPNPEEPPSKNAKVESSVAHVFANGSTNSSIPSSISSSTPIALSASGPQNSPSESLSNNTSIHSHTRSGSNTNSKADLSSFILDKTIEDRHRQKINSPTLTNSSFFYDRKDMESTPSFASSHSSSASFRHPYSPSAQPPQHLPPPPFYNIPGKHPRGPGFCPPHSSPFHHHPMSGPYLHYPLPPLAPGTQAPQGLGPPSFASPFAGPQLPGGVPPQFPHPFSMPGYVASPAPPSEVAANMSPKAKNTTASGKSPRSDPRINGTLPWSIPNPENASLRMPPKSPIAESTVPSTESEGFKYSTPGESRPPDLVPAYAYGPHSQQGSIPPPPPPHHHYPHHLLQPSQPPPPSSSSSEHNSLPTGRRHRHHHHHHHHPHLPSSHGHPPPPPHLFYGFYGHPPPFPPQPSQNHHYYFPRMHGQQREDYEYFGPRPGFWLPPYPYPQQPVGADEETESSKSTKKEKQQSSHSGSGMSIDNLVSSDKRSRTRDESMEAREDNNDDVSMAESIERTKDEDVPRTETRVKSSIGFINNETSPNARKNNEATEAGKSLQSDSGIAHSISSSSSPTVINFENSCASATSPKQTEENAGQSLNATIKEEEHAKQDSSSNTTLVASSYQMDDLDINVELSDSELAEYELPPFEDLKKYLNVFYKYINPGLRLLMGVNAFLSQVVIRFDSASLHALISSVCELTKLICPQDSFKEPIRDESHWLALVFKYWDNLNDNGMILSYSLISLSSTIRYSLAKSTEINIKTRDLIYENGFVDRVNHVPKFELNKRQLYERHLVTNLLWDFYFNHVVFKRFKTGEPFKKMLYDNFEINGPIDNISFAKDELHFQVIGPWKDLIQKGDSISDFELLVYATKLLETILDAELSGEKLENNDDGQLTIALYRGPKTVLGDRANFVSLTALVTRLFLALRDTWIFEFFNYQVGLHPMEDLTAQSLRNFDELVATIKAMTAEKWAMYFQLFDVSLQLFELLEQLEHEPGIPDDALYVASLIFGIACSHKFYSSFMTFVDKRTLTLTRFGGTYVLPETLELKHDVLEEFKTETLDKRINNLKRYMTTRLRFVTEDNTRKHMTGYICKLEHYVIDMLNSLYERES